VTAPPQRPTPIRPPPPTHVEVERAEHARNLLQNPALLEAFEKLDETIVRAWKNSLLNAQAGAAKGDFTSDRIEEVAAQERETLFWQHRALQQVHSALTNFVRAGRIEDAATGVSSVVGRGSSSAGGTGTVRT